MNVPSTNNLLRKKNAGGRRIYEAAVRLFCLLCAGASILTTIGIIYVLVSEGLHFFQRISVFEFFGGTKWAPTFNPPSFGVLPLLSGTFMIVVGSALIAVPLGLAVAIYMSEYASPKVRGALKPALEILAGIPTVVYGFFGLFVVTPFLTRIHILPEGANGPNGLAGCIVVGIMILPLVSSLCEDALRAVPKNLREAAFGLGSTKFEVVMKIVFPAALSGIVSAIILAFSRAVGETMAVTLAAGANPTLTLDPRQPIQTMTAYIVQISKGDTPAGSTAYYTLFAVGLTLFVITFISNLFANWVVRRYRTEY